MHSSNSLALSRGELQTVALDLVEGQRYALLCFLPSPDGNQTQAVLGMNAEFRPR
jgi:hypothetical protein